MLVIVHASGANVLKNISKIQLLENIRGFAAFYVFLGHVILVRFGMKSGSIGFLFRFGQEAVMLFFLLSGFVIYYSFSKSSDHSFSSYFIRRTRRIYPIFFLALAAAYFVNCLNKHTFIPIDLRELGGNILMLQDFKTGKPGVWFSPYLGNAPLWSLSYEWWFYMLFFPIITRVPVVKQRYLAFGLSIIGFGTYWLAPNAISLFLWYFIIWWSGVEAARVYASGDTPSWRNLRVQAVILSLMCFAQAIALVTWKKILHHPTSFGLHPVLEFRHFVFSLIVFVLALWSSPAHRHRMQMALRPFAMLAPISYGLYILHYPITVESHFLNGIHNRWLETLVYCVIAVALAWIAEIPYQSFMNKWIRVKSNKSAKVVLSHGEEIPQRDTLSVE
jgi:peptidoglycan/LPS O-acetylase OafA/YrhL